MGKYFPNIKKRSTHIVQIYIFFGRQLSRNQFIKYLKFLTQLLYERQCSITSIDTKNFPNSSHRKINRKNKHSHKKFTRTTTFR